MLRNSRLAGRRILGYKKFIRTSSEIPSEPKKEHPEEFNTLKGEFKGEYQGYGNVDRLDEMFYPEWRT
jgi:hypothetical protein